METPKKFGNRFLSEGIVVERSNCVILRAKDEQLGDKEVAIKVFRDRAEGKSDLVSSFEEEVKALCAASHRCLVPVVFGGCEEGWLYLVMERIEGPILADIMLNRKQSFEPAEAVSVIKELGGAIAELHEQRIIHGHIDSRSVLFKGSEPRLAGYCPMSVDKLRSASSDSASSLADPRYVAPEQLAKGGVVENRTDIYALAVLLYEMLAGKPPFVGKDSADTAQLRLTQSPVSASKHNSAVGPLLDAAIMKALAKDPKQRFETVFDFVDAVTGGKKEMKNPLMTMMAGSAPERMSTETIAVSMSTDKIKEILKQHEGGAAPAPQAPLEGGSSTKLRMPSMSSSAGVAETMMSIPAQQLVPGSLMAVEGPMRGQKYSLDRSPILMGSDPGCNICLSGKEVPFRFAIIVKKDSGYFIGPLSAAGLVINGEKVEGVDEVEIKRGDVVSAGPHKLRYIAPGEVFTLHDDVADRAIDRPKSRMPAYFAILGAALAVVCIVVVFFYWQSVSDTKSGKEQAALARKQSIKETIAKLRIEGDQFFKSGQLIEPVGLNARRRFEQILELDPDDIYAKRRLTEIEERVQVLAKQEQQRREQAQRIAMLLTDGEKYFGLGNLISPPGANAKDSFQEVLRIDPKNEQATAKLAEIDKMLGDMLGRVRGLIDAAREFKNAGHFVEPTGANAYENLQAVFSLDSANQEAKNLLFEMAAESIYAGDLAKSRADAQSMKRNYLVAQMLGVDPEYVSARMRGADLMRKSKASVIIYGGTGEKEDKGQSKGGGKYLDTSEIEKRLAVMKFKDEGPTAAGEERFIELNRR